MTAPTLDLASLTPEEIPPGVPNHRATSGEKGEPRLAVPKMSTGKRRIFGRPGGASEDFANNERPRREPPPKLSPAMLRQLEDFYSGVGAMVMPFDPVLGQTIVDNAKQCAKSVYNLAQANDAVRRFVIAFTTTSATGAVIFAHLPILLALARHSKNERIRDGAQVGMVALKFASAADAENLFKSDQDSDSSGDAE